MITCTRRVAFCAGHRVFGHENKCRHPHGHNYVAYFEAEAPRLDTVGRVIDFSVLKELLGGWIDEKWDHAFIYWQDDAPMRNSLFALAGEQGKKPKMYAMPTNPTAENMAEYLLREIAPAVLFATGVRITKVTIEETENCTATAVL